MADFGKQRKQQKVDCHFCEISLHNGRAPCSTGSTTLAMVGCTSLVAYIAVARPTPTKTKGNPVISEVWARKVC